MVVVLVLAGSGGAGAAGAARAGPHSGHQGCRKHAGNRGEGSRAAATSVRGPSGGWRWLLCGVRVPRCEGESEGREKGGRAREGCWTLPRSSERRLYWLGGGLSAAGKVHPDRDGETEGGGSGDGESHSSGLSDPTAALSLGARMILSSRSSPATIVITRHPIRSEESTIPATRCLLGRVSRPDVKQL